MSNIRNRFRKLKKYTAWFTLCLYLLQPCLAAAADVVADANAAKNKQPIVDKTANGITIVHIATPSETGISHNYYQQFNVDSRGLILNNARVITQTQLAGYIAGNPNLSGGSARLILNEVTGTGRSYLRGYTEIAGAKADLILANPNGIVGNGFGFINAGRTTLTTGTPLFGGSGSLEAFRVTGGQISVAGSGLDGSRADRVDLISQSVQVNAGMWAKKLNVITGNNKVDYNNLDVQKINDAKTTVALDVGQLGGMYAGKISLIGTAQGVGVNSLGTISALNDDLMINQTGKIIMAGSTSAIGNVVLTSNDNIMNQGSLGSRQSTTINAQGMLINTGILTAGQNMNIIADAAQSSGTIGSGIQTDGSVGNTGDLTLRVNKTASINGQNIAAGNLTVQGAALDIAGGKSSAGLDIGLLASAGDINHTGGTLQTNNKVTITTTGALINDQAINGMAGQITARQMSIAAGNISNHGGRIVQTGTDDTHITSQADLDNTQGTILTKGALNIQAQGEFLNQQGSMQADKNLFVAAQTVNNTKGSLLSLDNSDLTVQTTQAIDNTAGTIGGNGNVNLTSTGLKNAVGQVISGGSLTAAVTGNIDNKDGKLAANQDITLTAQTIQGGGSAKAGRDMNLTASKTIHHLVGGDFAANRNVTIVADTVTSEGSITGVHNVTVTAAAITNASGAKLAGG
ncbi:filamentous hemagglutinin family N-terminal domain-containing protein, partial [Propionispira arboris]